MVMQAEWPDYTIQIDAATGRKSTFSQLHARARLTATALGSPRGLNLQGGGDEMVGLIGDNSLNYVDTVMALLVLATPFALISSYSTPFEMVHALKLTKATRLFVDARLVSRVLQALKDPGVHIKPENVYVLAGKTSGARKSLAGMVEQARKGGWAEEEVRPAKRDTLAYLVMSSGTSGLPKGAFLLILLLFLLL
jgi:acyl-CoA synthetase (AMP-forming)/AMP-acid ligase II